MRLHEVNPINRSLAVSMFGSGDQRLICEALLRVTYNDEDWRWVQGKCLYFLNTDLSDVKKVAVSCLGHLARIHGKLESDKVLPVLTKLRSDPLLSGRVEDALDDIDMFLN